MSTVAIVALPVVDDKVYQISSEKVPHLTLCFLGDADSISDEALVSITQFVEHASSELSPFGMTVDHRGELGPDQADVVFFENPGWDGKRIRSFRAHLLQNDAIKTAYNSVDQFPEWTPHLTLGYPATPAHEDDSDYPGIHHVQFDRIAVWIGDFEGPEFRLKYDNSGDMAAAWSEDASLEEIAGAILKHHGTKGMKWGVRKAEKLQSTADRNRRIADGTASKKDRAQQFLGKGHRSGVGGALALNKKGAARRADKLDKKADKILEKVDNKWERSIYTLSSAVKVHNTMAEHFNPRIAELNAKHPEADIRNGEDTPEWKNYMVAVNKLQSESYSHAISTVHGTSPSGKKKAEYFNDGKGDERIVVHSAHLAHADDNEPDLILLAKTDEQGRILELNTAELELEHGNSTEDFFAHYGVKGMRWGVTTKDRATQRTPTDVVVSQKKPGKFAKASGGKNHEITDEAKAALVLRQKAKSSTTDALTNAELRQAVTRMQLEQQYTQLQFSNDRRSASTRFIAGLFDKRRPVKYKDLTEEAGAETRAALKDAFDTVKKARSTA